jgi:CelD/BcsL family acetyltransferase involved in cellulose biosynthesis
MNAMSAFVSESARRGFAPAARTVAPPSVEFMAPETLLADAALLAKWDALANDASEPNPFAERWYLAAALRALESDKVRVAVVRNDGLIGIIPLLWQSRYAGLPVAHVQNWLNHNAFLGTPLVRKGAESAFWAALLAKLDHDTDGALFLHLTGMATEGAVARSLAETCGKGSRRHGLVQLEERALLEQGLSPDAYLETHVRGKKRKELRRQHKRLAEEGTLTFERNDGSMGLDTWIAEFLALEKSGWKGANGSALDCADSTRALFRGALQGAAQAGKLELLTLRLDGRAIAMLANFLNPPGAFSFKTAFDENYARFSPGVLIQIENLALLERDGIDWCDSCAAQDHPMIDSLWAGRRAIGRYSVAIGGTARRTAFAALLGAEMAKAKFKGKNVQ